MIGLLDALGLCMEEAEGQGVIKAMNKLQEELDWDKQHKKKPLNSGHYLGEGPEGATPTRGAGGSTP